MTRIPVVVDGQAIAYIAKLDNPDVDEYVVIWTTAYRCKGYGTRIYPTVGNAIVDATRSAVRCF